MSLVFRSAVLLTVIACSAACAKETPADGAGAKPAANAAAAASPAAERKRNSTMIGMDIAKSLDPIKDEVDVDALAAALRASFAGKPTGLTAEEADKIRTEFGAKMQQKLAQKSAEKGTKNLAEGEAFLAANKSKPGVRTTASGLQYQVIRMGNGPLPKATDRVRVNYVGTLLDGTKFDSSVDRGEPAQFALNAVIPGWTEALQLMNVGSKYTLWIPANLAYGDRGTPGPIGPNATLKFDVELMEIVKQ